MVNLTRVNVTIFGHYMHNYVPENQANLISMLIRYATRRVRCTVTLDHYDDTIFNITLI